MVPHGHSLLKHTHTLGKADSTYTCSDNIFYVHGDMPTLLYMFIRRMENIITVSQFQNLEIQVQTSKNVS